LAIIGQSVKDLRAAAGLTQQELAVRAGLSVSVVSQIEQVTNADPRLSTLAALAGALGVSLDQLAGGVMSAPDPSGEKPAPKKITRGRKKT
jgi:transcriptional regulator with XRE-family HTH domain